MAVVQISRIQIRRGQANSGSGLPQLASGELAWAIDTQELYIGNGSVAEGAPGVGNTKVLTQNDISASGNFLTLLEYVYKVEDPSITTGPSGTNPVKRTLQARLDDTVSLNDFIHQEDIDSGDYTAALQRAIDQLFYNPAAPSYGTSWDSVKSRATLVIPPGVYPVSDTIKVPSHASIIGAGRAKTVIFSSVAGPAFQFIHDGYPTAWNGDPLKTPRYIALKNLSIQSTQSDQTALLLNSAIYCRFENLTITGAYSGTYNANSKGIDLTAFSDTVCSYGNTFKDVRVEKFSYGIYAKHDIYNNSFEDCYIYDVRQGIVFGEGADGSSIGQKYGPRNNSIVRCFFDRVRQHAFYVNLGSNNIIRNSNVYKSGANLGNISGTAYPQVYFKTTGNRAVEIDSFRTDSLATSVNLTVPYIPEVGGLGTYEHHLSRRVTIGQATSASFAFRLPVPTTGAGVVDGNIVYKVEYMYHSNTNNFTRRGTLTISANIGSAPSYTPKYQLSDEYDFAGTDGGSPLKSTALAFSVEYLDQTGQDYIASPGQVPSSICVRYTNTLNENGVLTYTYKTVQ